MSRDLRSTMCQSRQPHMIILRMSTPSPRREMGKQWRHPAGKRLGFTWTPSWPGPDDVPGCSPSFRCRRGGRMHHSSCFELQSRWNWPGGVERARQLGSRERVCNVSVVEDGLDELAVGTCSSPVPCWNSLNRPLVVVVSMGGALEPQDDGREGAPRPCGSMHHDLHPTRIIELIEAGSIVDWLPREDFSRSEIF